MSIRALGWMGCAVLLVGGCGGTTEAPYLTVADAQSADVAQAADAAREDASVPGPDAAPTCADRDGDGTPDEACGGTDCDDSDATRYPGNTERCDPGRDEDCNSTTLGPDADGDGYIGDRCCNPRPGTTPLCGDDCDPSDPSVSPAATEACNGRDDDCDGVVDEGTRVTCYLDRDSDGFAAASSLDDRAMQTQACACPGMYTALVPDGVSRTDCDDTSATRRPQQPENCVTPGDDNCDPSDDGSCTCTVGMTRACVGAVGRCAAGTQSCVSLGAGAGWSACSIVPVAETCTPTTFADDDCNGLDDIQEGLVCYTDQDGDGLAPTTPALSCPASPRMCGTGTTSTAPTATVYDCDDGAPLVRAPGASYVDGDRDGVFAPTPVATTGCPATGAISIRGADCNDNNPNAFPGQSAFFEGAACTDPRGNSCVPGGPFACLCFGDFNCDGRTETEPVSAVDSCGGPDCVGAPRAAAECGANVMRPRCLFINDPIRYTCRVAVPAVTVTTPRMRCR